MIISYFRSNSRSLATILPIWATVLYFRLFLWPSDLGLIENNAQMPLFSAFIAFIPMQFSFVASIVTLLLVFIELHLINLLSNRYLLLEQRTYLPAFIFVLISGFLTTLFTLSAVHFGVIFFLLAIKHLIAITKTPDVRPNFFYIGFYLATGSLFYIGLVPMFIAFSIGLFFAYPFDKRLWIISLLGYLLPFIFYFSILFLFDFDINSVINKIANDFVQVDRYNNFKIPTYFFLGFLFIIFTASGIRQIRMLSSRNVVSRRLYITLFAITIAAVIFILLIPGVSIEFLYIVAVPVAFLFADFVLLLQSKLFEDSVFILLLLFSIFVSIVS